MKQEAKELIDAPPEQATRDDIMYELHGKKKIEMALREAAGDAISHGTARGGFRR